MRCVNARRGTRLRGLLGPVCVVARRAGGVLDRAGALCGRARHWGDGPVVENARQMPGARFFPRARLNFAAKPAQVRRRAAGAGVSQRARHTRAACPTASCVSRSARVATGLRDAGVGCGRPGCRISAQPSGDHDRDARHREPRGDLVLVLAGLRRARRARSLRTDHPEGALHRRRLFLRGQEARFAAADGRGTRAAPGHRARSGDPVCGRCAADLRLSGPRRRGPHCGDDFGAAGRELDFAPLPFNHPLYIMYSSGTTGVPKCIVHGAGGTLLQHQKEHLLHTDLRRGDRLFYFTTCGWMMWNWLMSALASGATLVLYDGSPFHPGPDALWTMAQEERITIFGTSAKYLASLQKSNYQPGESCGPERAAHGAVHRLAAAGGGLRLRLRLGQGGRAALPRSRAAPTSSPALHLGARRGPVYRGEIQCRGLGMAVEMFDDAGQAARAASAASWCARRPSPRCRSGSGTIRTARNTVPPTSSASRAYGITAITQRSPSTMDW